MRCFHNDGVTKSFNNNFILNNTIKTSCKMQTKGDLKNILTHETNEVNLDDIVASAKQRLIQMGNKFLLERAPGIIASQQRFDIFQNLLKENIKENMKVCSLPCGLMDDLLTLEIPNINNVEFIGIDIDENSVSTAKAYAKSLNLDKICNFYVMDAWKMDFIKEFDIVTSNMLVQYVSDEDAIMKFYKLVFNSLKNDGIFIISCLLPMSAVDWSKSKYDMKDVKLSAVVFYDIIQAKWTQFILREKMIKQLIETGFKTFETYYDEIKRFPSLLAKK
jgi:ubiquinone/menaquinone biosynthesis C-methylase UbiE